MTRQAASEQGEGGRQFEFTRADFDRIRALVRRHTGISLGDHKQELVYGRVSRRLNALGLSSFAQYCELLESDSSAELESFRNAVTTNLTSFFRENHHFEYLAQRVLPELQARNAAENRLRVWSAGCSTGEEPYSVAMTILENWRRIESWDARMLATDLDSQVLATAREGIYPAERLDPVPESRRRRWFSPVRRGEEEALRANEELRRFITFKQLNLMNAWPVRGPFDIIFCRNVVIYFDKETQRQLFERIAALQRPGDYLFIGHSESLHRICDRYELVGKTIYQRIA